MSRPARRRAFPIGGSSTLQRRAKVPICACVKKRTSVSAISSSTSVTGRGVLGFNPRVHGTGAGGGGASVARCWDNNSFGARLTETTARTKSRRNMDAPFVGLKTTRPIVLPSITLQFPQGRPALIKRSTGFRMYEITNAIATSSHKLIGIYTQQRIKLFRVNTGAGWTRAFGRRLPFPFANASYLRRLGGHFNTEEPPIPAALGAYVKNEPKAKQRSFHVNVLKPAPTS